jgi:hypothetical protein
MQLIAHQAACSSEMLVDFEQATQHYIPADITLHIHSSFEQYSKLKSCYD